MPLLKRYNVSEKVQLRILAGEVLRTKRMFGVQGFELTEKMRVMIATQVAMLLLGLRHPKSGSVLHWVRNWNQVVVYPTAYHNGQETVFNIRGELQSREGFNSGETHYQGGIIINWTDNEPHPLSENANQVLMHEMAHKFDMLDGDINGHPPLHSNMSQRAWYQAFSKAFELFNRQLQGGNYSVFAAFNPYGATNPAEFFAVSTEYFFEAPHVLNRLFPEVYLQLTLFYRQDPLLKVLSKTS